MGSAGCVLPSQWQVTPLWGPPLTYLYHRVTEVRREVIVKLFLRAVSQPHVFSFNKGNSCFRNLICRGSVRDLGFDKNGFTALKKKIWKPEI